MSLQVTKLSPNPTSQNSKVEFSYKVGDAPNSLVCYDVNGYIVFKKEIEDPSNNNCIVDISGLSAGTYFIALVNSKYYSEAVKLIVQ